MIKGPAKFTVMVSAFWMATDFGASSPTTTCKNVMREKAITKEISVAADSGIFNSMNKGSIIAFTVGSPSHPMPREVMVMPSWVADKYSSKCVMTRFALIAFLFPSSISWLILVARTLTIAN